MSRRLRIVIAIAGAVAGALVFIALETGSERAGVGNAIADVVTGWSFIAAGLIASARRSDSRAPMLMVVVGFAWFAPSLWYVETSLTLTLGELFQGFQWLVLAYLLVTFPTGRANTRLERLTVLLLAVYVIPNAIGTLPFDPARECAACRANLLSIDPDPGLAHAVRIAQTVWALVFLPCAVTVVVQRWRRAGSSARRAYTPVFAAAVIPIVVAIVGIVRGLPTEQSLPHWSVDLAFLSLSCGLLIGLLRSWFDRSAVGELVVELGAASTPDRLREALARALHDPTVELLYWDGPRHAYVDGHGQTRDLPTPGPGRTITKLGRGESVGALLHDPALLEDPQLIEAVGEAARLALENERLQAEVRAQLKEVRASRARILDAADTERKRLERDLHDGAQQRIVTLSLALALAQEQAEHVDDGPLTETLAEASEEIRLALSELRELAQGLHPTILTEAGLGPALQSLAERSAVSTRVSASPRERLAPAVEATAYFVVSEALANIAKHARASRATISARREGGELIAEVVDDGIGGAAFSDGSGLAGLRDRVAARGGTLEVEGAPGAGTRLTARIPCG